MSATAVESLAQAEAALERGDFEGTIEHVRASLASGDLAAAHDLYAGLLLADDRLDESRAHWETAFRLYRKAGEDKPAIKVAAAIAGLHDDAGNRAAARGWLNRGRRLADAVGHCVERGYLALALLACDIRHATELERAAASALELAIEFGDPNLEARALADGGVALITQGRIAEGFARLDEAMAPLSAGEVTDPAQAGSIFCAMLTACERTGEIARAEEWLRACESFRATHLFGRFPVLHAHCRIAYGRVLCDAGRLDEAESELRLTTHGPAVTAFVTKQAAAAGVLADLRMTQGRLLEAAELLAPFADRFEVCEQLARLKVMQGEHDLAVATIGRALNELTADRLRACPLLALLTEAELARGDVGAARAAADRLTADAEQTESPRLAALAHVSLGRCAIAEGEAAAAAESFTAARRALGMSRHPVLAARIGLELAFALAATGEQAAAIDEASSALAAFERLGASLDADRTAALLRDLGVPGRARRRSLDDELAVLTAREREVLDLLGEGLSNAAIAARLFISAKTAEHHVGKILSKLGLSGRAEAAALVARGAQGPVSSKP